MIHLHAVKACEVSLKFWSKIHALLVGFFWSDTMSHFLYNNKTCFKLIK